MKQALPAKYVKYVFQSLPGEIIQGSLVQLDTYFRYHLC